MKCYLCKLSITPGQINHGDAYKLKNKCYVHHDCGMEEASASAWGGARKGAGRKPSPELHKRINVYLSIPEIEKLKRIDPSTSKAIRKLLEPRD